MALKRLVGLRGGSRSRTLDPRPAGSTPASSTTQGGMAKWQTRTTWTRVDSVRPGSTPGTPIWIPKSGARATPRRETRAPQISLAGHSRALYHAHGSCQGGKWWSHADVQGPRKGRVASITV